jgi:hypothetical protein
MKRRYSWRSHTRDALAQASPRGDPRLHNGIFPTICSVGIEAVVALPRLKHRQHPAVKDASTRLSNSARTRPCTFDTLLRCRIKRLRAKI